MYDYGYRGLFSVVLAFALIFSFVGRGEDGLFDSDGFTNELTVGKGIDTADPLELAVETDTFTSIPEPIYWRLETDDDMKGSAVIMEFKEFIDGVYVNLYGREFPFRTKRDNLGTHGHIMVSNFWWDLPGK